MNREEIFESGILEMYVLGLTSPEETRMVEEMASQYPDIQKEIDNLHKALEQYAAQHSIPPPPGLKRKVMKRVDNLSEMDAGNNSIQPTRARSLFPNLTLAASILFLLWSLFLLFQNRSSQQMISSLQSENYRLIKACEEEKENFTQKQKVFAFLHAPGTQPVRLKGSPVSPGATALVFWNETMKKVMISPEGMPAPPDGQQYQVWADVEGVMVNMGLIDPEKSGVQEVEYIAHAESVNVTLEPIGGSEHPTVSRLYVNAPLEI
jgi:anti-sigma-K factor RskA